MVVCGSVWWCVIAWWCGSVCWCVVVYDSVWECVVVCGGVGSAWWCVVVCGSMQWCVVVCSVVVVCGSMSSLLNAHYNCFVTGCLSNHHEVCLTVHENNAILSSVIKPFKNCSAG